MRTPWLQPPLLQGLYGICRPFCDWPFSGERFVLSSTTAQRPLDIEKHLSRVSHPSFNCVQRSAAGQARSSAAAKASPQSSRTPLQYLASVRQSSSPGILGLETLLLRRVWIPHRCSLAPGSFGPEPSYPSGAILHATTHEIATFSLPCRVTSRFSLVAASPRPTAYPHLCLSQPACRDSTGRRSIKTRRRPRIHLHGPSTKSGIILTKPFADSSDGNQSLAASVARWCPECWREPQYKQSDWG